MFKSVYPSFLNFIVENIEAISFATPDRFDFLRIDSLADDVQNGRYGLRSVEFV